MKKSLSVFLSFVMLLSVTTGLSITAQATSITQSQAVSWANSQIGKYLDYDGVPAGNVYQCVDLTKYYYAYLGVTPVKGNGCDYVTNSLPSGWQRIPYSNGFSAQPGDIAVWTYSTSAYGHVAIVTSASTSTMSVVEQNASTGTRAHSYSYSYGTFYGVIRPNFVWDNNYADILTPTLSINKSSFMVGETASISWTKSPSNSDFKHYWLVITNTTTGNQYFGGATGGYGDVDQNQYSFIVNEAGIYNVTVYAVKSDGNGKSDSKNFSVASDDVSVPTISINKTSFLVGETANITWTKSSSSSDFKHYWLIITNTTTGNQYFGGATGGYGDTTPNYYDLKITEAGNYKVSVYSVKSDGSGKSDSKTFIAATTDISVPTISINKTSFLVGETANIIWTKSSSNSDFKHYWLVITNTTTGKQYYGSATGRYGDTTQNYYDLKLTEAGTYKVDVYTVRSDGSGKSNSKTFFVSNNCEHSYSSNITKPATCTATGIKLFTCSKCGDSYTETIAKKPHTTVKDSAVAPACTTSGLTEGSHCSVCGTVITEQKTVAETGHRSDNGTVTKKPTYSETGIKEYKCTVCGKMLKTETLDKLEKKANTLTASGKTKAIKFATLKKKSVSIERKDAITVSKAQGKVTYKKASGNKNITVSSAGKITVKKGLKKGTYKIKVKVKAAGNATYKAKTVTVTVTIKVK